MALHVADFDNMVGDFNTMKKNSDLIGIFIRSLHSETLKYLLFAQVKAVNESDVTLEHAMNKTQELEDNVLDHPSLSFSHEGDSYNQLPPDEDSVVASHDSMDFEMGHIRRGNNNNNYTKSRQHDSKQQSSHSYQQHKYAYTNDGRPICDFCQIPGHLTKRCRNNPRSNKKGKHNQKQSSPMILLLVQHRPPVSPFARRTWYRLLNRTWPTRAKSYARLGNPDSTAACPFCAASPEHTPHMALYCPSKLGVWSQVWSTTSPKIVLTPTMSGTSLRHGVQQLLSHVLNVSSSSKLQTRPCKSSGVVAGLLIFGMSLLWFL
ncbi:hypothetical protein [Absidia glauca]|uniref:Reverse transcriptase zinc-binding domain-containing protein n=1 Tax=Absidia glauca TaxID=4829 RepID=A0A168S991_ABSGL|nr:hypothetical protein [Absidia glauca]